MRRTGKLKYWAGLSLRARFVLLAAAAGCAVLASLGVAWRLARATDVIIKRQSESAVRGAAQSLAQPEETLEDVPFGPAARHGRHSPPHHEKIIDAYQDPAARRAALALVRWPDTTGGFLCANNNLCGQAASDGGPLAASLPTEVQQAARAAAQRAVSTHALVSESLTTGDGIRFFIAAAPLDEPDAQFRAAWAVRGVAQLGLGGDAANFIAWGALALSLLAVGGLAMLTLRSLRDEVGGLENDLARLGADLQHPVHAPDTPELKRIALAVNDLAADLRETLAQRQTLAEELRRNERLAALGRLVAGVAHEVRNPLAAIKLKIQLAQRAGYPPEKLAATFRVVDEEVARLENLVRRLLEVGRAGQLEKHPVRLAQELAERAALLREVAAQQQVTIISEPAPENLLVDGDTAKLAQVFDNLLHNALQATPAGGTIRTGGAAWTDAEGVSWASVWVQDDGPGLTQEAQERLFEPFFTTRAEGTGLGLTIAREIILAHGGRLRAVNAPDGGARFSVELPAHLLATDY